MLSSRNGFSKRSKHLWLEDGRVLHLPPKCLFLPHTSVSQLESGWSRLGSAGFGPGQVGSTSAPCVSHPPWTSGLTPEACSTQAKDRSLRGPTPQRKRIPSLCLDDIL